LCNFFEKIFKKVLTFSRKYDIINTEIRQEPKIKRKEEIKNDERKESKRIS
jgi:hypothetical protein